MEDKLEEIFSLQKGLTEMMNLDRYPNDIEGRISEIAAKLGAAQIINIKEIPRSGKIIFGVTVRLLNLDTDEEVTYKIVGDDEADIKVNKISVYSPVARSLIGKQQDDVVLIQIPSGQIEYEILSVEHL